MRSRAKARLLCSGGEGKGKVYVGNKGVASTRDVLEQHEVTHIVNCTVSRPTIQAHATLMLMLGSGRAVAGPAS